MSIINQQSVIENLTYYDRQNLIWDCICKPTEKLVLFALNMHGDGNGESFPGLKRIEKKCGIGRADRITDRLMHLGLIIKKQRFDENGRQTSNGYQILFEALRNEIERQSGEMDRESTSPDEPDKKGEVDRRSISQGGSSGGGEVDRRSTKLDHIELDHLTRSLQTHIDPDPERVCEEKKNDPETGSVIVANEPESLPVFSSPIGGDNFSAAAPQKTSIEGFPIGPWGPSLFEIDAGFVGWMIAQWRKGDGRQSQVFGKMACEEVRACLQKYWKKDWSTLSIDWDAYSANTQRLVEAVSGRMRQGIEISTQEQKLLNDRVKGPEHLRPQPLHSVPQQAASNALQVQRDIPSGAVPLIAASELSALQIEEIKRSSEAARSNLVTQNQGLFSGRLPIDAFMLWLESEAKKHLVPGMSLRSIALTLGRRTEMQEAFLESLSQDF